MLPFHQAGRLNAHQTSESRTMKRLHSSGDLNLFHLSQQLLEAGWEAYASDMTGQVAARQDHLPHHAARTLTIDRSGRWRFTATSRIGMADGRELMRCDQTWRLLKETQQILTIAGRLSSQDDLPELLAELTQLAQEETSPTGPRTEGKPPWHEDHDLRTELSAL